MLVWGDGTVPVQSAKAVSSLSSFTKVYLRGGMHDNLCSNPDVVQTISNILKNGIPKASTPLDSVSDELVTSYQITASGNVFLHAYDSLTNHTGASSDTTSEANIPGSFYYRGGGDDSSMISILVLPRKPGYKIRVDSVKNSVPITLDVDDITAGRDVSFLDYRDIQLSSMGFATLSLDSVYADVSLKLDVHGDGSDVRIVPPSNFVVNAIRNRQSLTGEAPQGFALRQNYPNPFNPSTTIKYDLPKASLVWLSVFDILGRQVSVLVNERRDAGVHEVKFDGSNLASGVYFYQLKAGDFVATKRLLLLK